MNDFTKTRDWIEKIIRNNRSGIAAHQLAREFTELQDEISDLKEIVARLSDNKKPLASQKRTIMRVYNEPRDHKCDPTCTECT